MKLHPGDTARTFERASVTGESVLLGSSGQKTMLSFYRYASCPLCNLRVHELITQYERLSGKGLRLIAVFESPVESILEYVGKQDVPFPIIADAERELYQLYGVESSWWKFAKAALWPARFMKAVVGKRFLPGRMEGDKTMVPADFLINGDGTIHTAYYGKNIGDHIPLEEIHRFLDNHEWR